MSTKKMARVLKAIEKAKLITKQLKETLIYIQPCEKGMHPELLTTLVQFTYCFYPGFQVKLRDEIDITRTNVRSREGFSCTKQYHAGIILTKLTRRG